MTMRPAQPAVYELTVTGGLGPVLRGALAPYVTASAAIHTVMRAGTTEDEDIVDLLLLLESRGIEVAGISAVD